LEYYKSTISLTPITNLDLTYQVTKHLSFSLGATNLLNRYPNHLNATLLSHYDNPAYGDNQGTIVYPTFSPIGFNGGFYFAKGTFEF
jgi:iron complex outermembrane receptor protein